MPGFGVPFIGSGGVLTYREPEGMGLPLGRFGYSQTGIDVRGNRSPAPFAPRDGNTVVNTHGQRTALGLPRPPMTWRQFAKSTGSFSLSGVSRDSTGAALAACTVLVFNAHTNEFIGQTVSDGSGNWSVVVPTNSPRHFVVEYKAGSPDVAGTSVNTLQAV